MAQIPSVLTVGICVCISYSLLTQWWIRKSETQEDATFAATQETSIQEEAIHPDWARTQTDCLVRILQHLPPLDHLRTTIVCKDWNWLTLHPLTWRTLNLSLVNPPITFLHFGVHEDGLRKMSSIPLRVSKRVRTLIFNVECIPGDGQLLGFTRFRFVTKIVLPQLSQISIAGLIEVIRLWPGLCSLSIPGIRDASFFMHLVMELAQSCAGFYELRVVGQCHQSFASSIVAFLPNLKKFSLRGATLIEPSFFTILEGWKHVQALDLTHCILIQQGGLCHDPKVAVNMLRETILSKTRQVNHLVTCSTSCLICARTMDVDSLEFYSNNRWRLEELRRLTIE